MSKLLPKKLLKNFWSQKNKVPQNIASKDADKLDEASQDDIDLDLELDDNAWDTEKPVNNFQCNNNNEQTSSEKIVPEILQPKKEVPQNIVSENVNILDEASQDDIDLDLELDDNAWETSNPVQNIVEQKTHTNNAINLQEPDVPKIPSESDKKNEIVSNNVETKQKSSNKSPDDLDDDDLDIDLEDDAWGTDQNNLQDFTISKKINKNHKDNGLNLDNSKNNQIKDDIND